MLTVTLDQVPVLDATDRTVLRGGPEGTFKDSVRPAEARLRRTRQDRTEALEAKGAQHVRPTGAREA